MNAIITGNILINNVLCQHIIIVITLSFFVFGKEEPLHISERPALIIHNRNYRIQNSNYSES